MNNLTNNFTCTYFLAMSLLMVMAIIHNGTTPNSIKVFFIVMASLHFAMFIAGIFNILNEEKNTRPKEGEIKP